VLVPVPEGQRQIPLGELARVKIAIGPAMIRDEDGSDRIRLRRRRWP
jgi:Cu/Ag efflux pump CusA